MPHRDEYDDQYDDGRGDDRDDDRRRDDRYDDERGEDRGRDYDDYEDRRESRGGSRVRRGREKGRPPGVILLIGALLCLALNVMAIALVWMSPDTIMRGKYDMMKEMFPQQPQPPYEEFVKKEQGQQTGIYSLRILASLLVVIGAMKMRSVQNYGLAMTASVVSLIPACVNECCCILPIGIWALIVLLNQQVKQGFSIVARGGSYE